MRRQGAYYTMFPYVFGSSKRSVVSVPHPELTPLTEEECAPPDFGGRDQMLSRRDYSDEEIARAKAQGYLPGDMREYCYNHGLSWQMDVKRPRRRCAFCMR